MDGVDTQGLQELKGSILRTAESLGLPTQEVLNAFIDAQLVEAEALAKEQGKEIDPAIKQKVENARKMIDGKNVIDADTLTAILQDFGGLQPETLDLAIQNDKKSLYQTEQWLQGKHDSGLMEMTRKEFDTVKARVEVLEELKQKMSQGDGVIGPFLKNLYDGKIPQDTAKKFTYHLKNGSAEEIIKEAFNFEVKVAKTQEEKSAAQHKLEQRRKALKMLGLPAGAMAIIFLMAALKGSQ